MIEEVTRGLEPRWRGQAPFVETWCLTLNHLNSGAGFWLRFAIVAPGRGPARAEIWFASFTPGRESASAAFGRVFPRDEIEAAPDGVRIGPSLMEPEWWTGMLDADDTPVTWDLEYRPVTGPLKFLAASRSHRRDPDLVVPYPFMLIGGKIQVRDHQYNFNGDPGQLSHSWGSTTPQEWAWFHCSAFIRNDGDPIPAYVSGISVRQPVLAGIAGRPRSFGHLVWNEKHVPLVAASPWGDRYTRTWTWRGQSGKENLDVDISIPWAEMVAAEQSGPTGKVISIHHTDLATCSVRISSPGIAPSIFTAARLAHAQIASPRRDRRVRRTLRVL